MAMKIYRFSKIQQGLDESSSNVFEQPFYLPIMMLGMEFRILSSNFDEVS